jgi:nucleotide-binding universal stress UspA family protein
MKTIIVTTDFSKNALNAVKYAFAYAEKTKSSLILYHAYITPTSELNLPLPGIHMGKQEAREGAEFQMKKVIASMVKLYPKAKAKWVVEPGIASDNIIKFIKKNKIDLLIMGTTGEGAISRALIGSTTSSIITNVPCTMIAVPPTAKFKGISKVIVATDLEKTNLSRAAESVTFAKQFQAEVKFVHIQDLGIFDAESILQKMTDSIKKEMKYKNISFNVYNDANIVEGLDLVIKKQKPDILSMMTYGRKFPETIWKTSWTNKMSNHTKIPLLVLHTSRKRA